MHSDSVTDRVAEQALDVVDVVVADVQEAIRAGNVAAIVTSTVDAFRGVASHLSKKKMSEDTRSRMDNEIAIEKKKSPAISLRQHTTSLSIPRFPCSL